MHYYAMKVSGCIDPCFLDLGTGWEWSPSRPGRFTPGERAPRYPLDRGLGRPQGRYGRHGQVRKFLTQEGEYEDRKQGKERRKLHKENDVEKNMEKRE
jgi:hypothetical protein